MGNAKPSSGSSYLFRDRAGRTVAGDEPSVLEGGCAAAKDFVWIELFGGDSRGGG